MPTLDTIIKTYEKKRKSIIERVIKRLLQLMDEGAGKAAFLAQRRRLIGKALPDDLLKSIDDIVRNFDIVSEVTIVNGVKESWAIANIKNDYIAKTLVSGGGKKPPGSFKVVLGQAFGGKGRGSTITIDTKFGGGSQGALSEFIKRSDNGMTISRRVWKLSQSYKKILTASVKEGIAEGKDARTIANEIKKNLRSDTFQESPGQGIYSSPMKNAMRLTRSETNLAYANADYNRWQTQWFVTAIEIKTSNRHPEYDICDEMKGIYPKDFHFTMWHPQCLCIAIPKLATQQEQADMLDYQLGKSKRPPTVNYTGQIPDKAKAWLIKNASRIDGWSNTPYFVSNNPGYVGKIISKNKE